MSGGWSTTFTLTEQKEVTLRFYIKVTQSSEYESDEYSQGLLKIDGVLYGLAGNDYLSQVTGNGNGGSSLTTGWVYIDRVIGTLSAGTHTLVIGGYNNQKTYSNETTEVLIDNVVIAIR